MSQCGDPKYMEKTVEFSHEKSKYYNLQSVSAYYSNYQYDILLNALNARPFLKKYKNIFYNDNQKKGRFS